MTISMIEHFYSNCDLNLFCKHYIVFYTWMQKNPINWSPPVCGRTKFNPEFIDPLKTI